ncbi:DUF4840 domain-containing protein [Alloprevotella tannerae]|jgi:hypothetical protein|uniref:DUF4840 domain-containing protein n=1 Tax=Alloprevotella tannerae TaxID=76122 RepID=UPI0028EDD4C1|nr:DUF4840 domain-containing protein [Alloprevotella tannerae]
MKKATIFLPLLMLFGFLLTACETNEPKVPDSVRQSIKGNYSGQVGMVSIGNKRDTIRTAALATVTDKEINIDRVPVGPMVDTIFGGGTAAASGINTLPMKIKYTMYAANQAYYPMQFQIAELNFTVTQGKLTHKVLVVFERPTFDNMVFYFPGKGQLVLEARTARIIVDEDDIQMLGNKINPKRKFSFRFPTILKK